MLLSAVSLKYVIYFFSIDIGSFLLIKIIRGDFSYWLLLEGITNILVSLSIRVIVKIVNDFISIVQLRSPLEVGGAQSVFGQLTSFATLFIALHLNEASGKLGSGMDSLWLISYIITVAALFSYSVFFSSINQGYIHTFFSFETGGQMTIRSFREHEDEGLRAEAIFTNNRSQWKSIYEEVKEWVWQNWPKWIEEKPAWFDDKMRSMIPGDMIPSSDLKQIAAEGGKEAVVKRTQSSGGRRASQSGGRRLSSFEEGLRGAFTVKKKKKYAKIAPEGGGEMMTEEDIGELIEKGMGRRGSLRM